MKRFSEQFQLDDLDRHAVSDLTAEWLWDRQHNGIDDFSLKSLSVDKANMLLTFTAKPTRIIGKAVNNIAVNGQDVSQKGYSTQLSFLNPEEFLGTSSAFNDFSNREKSQLLSDYVKEGMVRVHCTCPAYTYQGHFEAMSSHDSDIYKYKGPKGTGFWRSKHSSGLSDNDITICKHLASIIEQISNFENDILVILIGKTWGGAAVVVAEPEIVSPEETPEKEPVLDTAIIRNKPEPEEIIEPPVEEPEEEPELDLPVEEEEPNNEQIED